MSVSPQTRMRVLEGGRKQTGWKEAQQSSKGDLEEASEIGIKYSTTVLLRIQVKRAEYQRWLLLLTVKKFGGVERSRRD